jgi:putative transposase
MDDSERDVLAYMTFPSQHCTTLHSTNPLERLNTRRSSGAPMSSASSRRSQYRLIVAVLFTQNDGWLLQCRYRKIEGMAAKGVINGDPSSIGGRKR